MNKKGFLLVDTFVIILTVTLLLNLAYQGSLAEEKGQRSAEESFRRYLQDNEDILQGAQNCELKNVE